MTRTGEQKMHCLKSVVEGACEYEREGPAMKVIVRLDQSFSSRPFSIFCFDAGPLEFFSISLHFFSSWAMVFSVSDGTDSSASRARDATIGSAVQLCDQISVSRNTKLR